MVSDLDGETKALVNTVGFEPIMCLLPKKAASGILVKALVERWWDTTYTFHIARREIIMTPHNFHQMTSLRSYGPIINLSGVQLGIDLLRRAYTTECFCYFDLEGTIGLFLRRLLMMVPKWLRHSCYICWGNIFLPMEVKQCL